jgi:hypothetical protein
MVACRSAGPIGSEMPSTSDATLLRRSRIAGSTLHVLRFDTEVTCDRSESIQRHANCEATSKGERTSEVSFGTPGVMPRPLQLTAGRLSTPPSESDLGGVRGGPRRPQPWANTSRSRTWQPNTISKLLFDAWD